MLEKLLSFTAMFAIVLAAESDNSFWMKANQRRFEVPDECLDPKTVGVCKANMDSWFYNSTTGQCESFVYGGCGGNRNRFESQALCQQTCLEQESDPCNQSTNAGNCFGFFTRWYYNQTTAKCDTFIYGGCGGNSNNFLTQALCNQTCVEQDPCKLPKYVGDCRAAIPRWYYNQDKAQCEEFDYGGCDANGNNFPSREQCEQKCFAPIETSS